MPTKMTFLSTDGKSRLEIESHDDGQGYSAFAVEATVDVGHGRFSAWNGDVQWLNLDRFAAALEQFATDRTSIPELEGTYDSRVGLSARGHTIFLEFAVGDAFCGEKTHDYLFAGSFELDRECLPGVLSTVRSLVTRA